MFDKEFFLKQMRDGVSVDDLASSIAEVLNEAEKEYNVEQENARQEAERKAAEKAKAEQVQKEKEADAKEIAECISCYMMTYYPKCETMHHWETDDVMHLLDTYAEMADVFNSIFDGHWPSFSARVGGTLGESASAKVNKFLKDFNLL